MSNAKQGEKNRKRRNARPTPTTTLTCRRDYSARNIFNFLDSKIQTLSHSHKQAGLLRG